MKTLQKQDASPNHSRAQANQPSTQGAGRPAVYGHFSLPAQLKKGVIQRVWFEKVGEEIIKHEEGDKPSTRGTHNPLHGFDYNKTKITLWRRKGSGPKQLSNQEKMASYPKAGVFEVDAADVMYSQDSIGKKFTDGTSYETTIAKFKKDKGYIVSDTLKPIRVLEGKNSRLVTLDNRRLYCAKEAGIKIKCQWATKEEIEHDDFKFTSGKGFEGRSTIDLR